MNLDYKPTDILVYDNPSAMIKAFPEPLAHYENDGAILLKDCGFEFDEAFMATVSFPPEWKKIGTVNHITSAPIIYKDGGFVRTHNPLCQIVEDDRLLLKAYSEFLRLELSFKLLVSEVFPVYKNIDWGNCTFRFSPTRREDVHLDVFSNGNPFPPEFHRPRLKLFLNVDVEPRVWNVGPRMCDVLKFSHDYLGPTLPADINMLCMHIDKSGALDHCPLTKVEIPTRGVVFANGSTVVHQVIYGNRAIGLEGSMPTASLLSSASNEWYNVRRWISEAGYSCLDAPPAAT
jgi:hypothetical protein